jgi:hypothetical protein
MTAVFKVLKVVRILLYFSGVYRQMSQKGTGNRLWNEHEGN